jgi:hypothetical protein
MVSLPLPERRLDSGWSLLSYSSMAWISTIAPEEASGLSERQDDAAVKRAGKVYQVIQMAGLFAYYNRLAEGREIDDEPEWVAAR